MKTKLERSKSKKISTKGQFECDIEVKWRRSTTHLEDLWDVLGVFTRKFIGK